MSFQQRLSDKMYAMKKTKQCLTRIFRSAIETKVLDFCLIGVQHSSYNFSQLETLMLLEAQTKVSC